MDFWATKTHGEQEDEETERLVHRAPKYKPPRHDRRRETIDTDRDPDIDDDPDLKKDPDLSMNYKNIGGSFTHAVVAARFIGAKGKKVKVRERDSGKVVNVNEETLKEEGGKYEKIDEAEDPEVAKRGDALRSMAKEDEKLQGAFKSLLNPKSDLGGLAESNPQLKAKAVFKDMSLPDGVETLGDLVKALRSKPSKPSKPKETPAKGPEDSASKDDRAAEHERLNEQEKKELANAADGAEHRKIRRQYKKLHQEADSGGAKDEKPTEPSGEKPAEAPQKPSEDQPAEPPGKKPESPQKPPGEKPTKPKAKRPVFDDDDDEDTMAEPSEATKAGIPPPKRREAGEGERMEAANLIMDTFPEHIATELLSKNLHPDDVTNLVNTYHATRQLAVKDPGAFASRAALYYEPDFDRVKPPKKWKNAQGKVVPFEKLTPDEKADAMRQHQVQVTALSLGAKEALSRSLSLPSKGTPTVAPALSNALATFMLRKGTEEQANKMAEQLFSTALKSSSSWDRVDPRASAMLLERLPPAAKKLASSYLQAADYHEAKNRFLGGSVDQMSEQSKPADIVRGLGEARKFFSSRAQAYGEDKLHRAQTVFQVRVMSRLRALAPEKYDEVRLLMANEQKAVYDQERAKYDKELKAWEARKKAWEAKQAKGHPYRDGEKSFEEEPPKEPVKPPLYHLAEDPKKARREAEAMAAEVAARTKGRPRKTSSVAGHLIFTYPGTHAMGSGSGKTAVYHGVDPMKNYPKPYAGWQQAHQRDLGEADFNTILSSAREWLKSSVLSVAVEGITRDQQCRAALDLAIRDSKYDAQIQPTLYNKLLAKLAGVPEPGLGQTLLTIREANSSIGAPKKGTTMKPSNELRKLAAKAAETNPKLAFEMLELAESLEVAPAPAPVPVAAPEQKTASAPMPDERYSKLRALVIRTAAVDAGAKKVLLPVLQEIKNLGG